MKERVHQARRGNGHHPDQDDVAGYAPSDRQSVARYPLSSHLGEAEPEERRGDEVEEGEHATAKWGWITRVETAVAIG